ncbi:MAG: diguanylate cyclase, partial [Myxococcota bacterium]
RRTVRGAWPVLGVVLLAGVVALQAAHPVDASLFAGFILLLLTVVGVRAWQRSAALAPDVWREVELGALLAVAAYATTIHVDGHLDGRYYPLVYVAVGVMSAFSRPAALFGVIGLMMGFEAAIRWLSTGHVPATALLPHAGFAMVFAVLNALSLQMEVGRLRRASRSELQAERARIREEARSYRLLRAPVEDTEESPPESRAQDEERLLRSTVEEIEMSVLLALKLVRESLGAHTALLLWGDDRECLQISEVSSDEDALAPGPFRARDGILGAVLSQRAPVCVAPLKPSYVLPYYEDVCPVRAVAAVPVFEQGTLRGVLVADRKEARPFDPHDVRLLEQAGHFCARSIANERVFVQLERTKVEQGQLYRAAERLGAAVTERDVVDVGVRAASEIATVDFAALTLFDPDHARHEIRAVVGDGGDALTGQTFPQNRGLCSMALFNRHPLPYRGEYDGRRQLVFGPGLCPPDGLPSLFVLPIIAHDQPLGTLVLGSHERGAFAGGARHLLEVLASHMGASLANARMVRRLEEQATTDPMTGLLNKRAMLDVAGEKLRSAHRFGRKLSVLVADIDHFKRVNDTFGHDVGDVVIKGLGAIHARVKRNTDAVARFGGEEFVTICEETGAEGARLLGERIRRELGEAVFDAHGEPVTCTCSIGIATFPESGDTWDELFKAADEALYASKRAGRNRVTVRDRGDRSSAA